jgi:hypothetical protein
MFGSEGNGKHLEDGENQIMKTFKVCKLFV